MGWPKGKPRGSKVPGSGRKPGGYNKKTLVIQEFARDIMNDEEYQRNLITRAKTGALAPALETLLFHYAFGRPPERVLLGEDEEHPFHTAEERLAKLAAVEARIDELTLRRRVG